MAEVMKPMITCAPSELKFDQAASDLQMGGTELKYLPEPCIALTQLP